ncbi:hypothetical protein ED733_000427 [Metarhizium rileyi]|uniref:Uncharacterized protein n=1 Tax=Metarhizium rileyi (strain RCEF 4871) TaxID=1649241 RepID=A0A5C6G3W7_METRR|nr:hypothetical protein ED733_000427 [Metarhizium rileyi]
MVGPESQDLALAQNPVAGFQPLHLEQVNARLIEISDNRTVESHFQPQDTQDGPEIASLCDEARDYETESYDEENDGGRSLYPISLLDEVSRDPEGHREMLWPFWNLSRDHGPAWLKNSQVAATVATGTRLLRLYLARHGFTRPLKLHACPKLQEKLTTWIEYLCFEYWWLDRYNDSHERLKLDHDKRWQELVDKKIPKPHETKDFVRTTPSSIERGREIEKAWEAKEVGTSRR